MVSISKGCCSTMKDHGTVPCILVFELFLKVSFYTFQLMLFLFLLQEMNYTYSFSLVIYHLFVGLGYIAVVICSMISESCMPKFFTIFLLTFNGIIGNVLIVLASTTASPDGLTAFSGYGFIFLYPGLFFRAFGICATRDLVRGFGEEQFTLPDDRDDLYNFYKLLYFFATVGTLLSYVMAPQIRTNVACYGAVNCFPLAFVVPACLIVIGLVLLAVGYGKYQKLKPKGSVALQCFKYMFTGNSGDGGLEFIADYHAAKKVLPLFVPLPIFWALLEQTGSRWTYQASRMDGSISKTSYTPHIEPDQMQILNPIFILLATPLTDYICYPVMNKCFLSTPLKRTVVGAILAVLAFVAATQVEKKIELSYVGPNWSNNNSTIMNATLSTGNVNATTPTITSHVVGLHMVWQIPQYFLISIAQFLFPLALIEFTFTQVASRMKQWLLAWYYICIALGHFIAMLAGFAGGFLWFSEYTWYWIFAGLMGADTLLVILISYLYPTIYEDD